MAVRIAVSELPQLGLEQREYIDLEHFALELERFWRPGWRFVCHESEIAVRGQYVRYDLAGDSMVVVRGEDRAVHALQIQRLPPSGFACRRRRAAASAAHGLSVRSTAGRMTSTARYGRLRRCTTASTARAGI